jgi:hypothetical protein
MEEKEEKFKIADPALLHVITPSPFEIGPSRFMRWVYTEPDLISCI